MSSQIISDYFEILSYDEFDETEAITKLTDLSRSIIFVKTVNFSKRFLETATIIKKNLLLFQSFFNHVDAVTTIIEYLKYYGMKFVINKPDKLEEEKEVTALITTLLYICDYMCVYGKTKVQLFLSTILLQNSDLEDSKEKIYSEISNHYTEAIIFEDSDFHAVVSVLNNFSFNIIWIQEILVVRILPHIRESSHRFIRIFRSKQELLDPIVSNMSSLISIWSEDIIAAKDLAASLNRDITFINTFMDIYGGIIVFPCTKKLDKHLELLQDESANAIIQHTSAQSVYDSKIDVYNLFYDGMWQRPGKDRYWLNEGHLWANATRDDIKKCIAAAEKGAKIWSTKNIDYRIQILFKLASTLECNNKHKLARIVSKWVKSSYFYGNSVICPQNGRLEITVKREPHGIVILNSESLDMLFWQLILALTIGNSVIVLCNSVHCHLALYCDMFSTSGIPPGVINMLSTDNVKNVKNALQKYYINETELLPEGNKENPYIKLTKPKTIILPLK